LAPQGRRGWLGALHLANLIKKHNAAGGKPELSAENIYVLEKGREIGAQQLSGAIMNRGRWQSWCRILRRARRWIPGDG